MPTYSYKGYDFDVDHDPTEEEFSQLSKYVDTLPPKEVKPQEAPKDESLMDHAKKLAKKSWGDRALEMGVQGPAETALGLITGFPGFVSGSLGKAKSLLTGKMTDAELEQAAKEATPGLFNKITYEPRTEAGKLYSKGVSKAFETAGEGLGATGSGLRAGVEAALEGSGQTGAQRKFKEYQQVVAPVTKAMLEIGMVGKGVKDLRDNYVQKQQDTVRKLVVEEEAKKQPVAPTTPETKTSLPELKDAPPLVPDSWKEGMQPKEGETPLPVLPDTLKPLSEQYPQGIDIGAIEGGVFKDNRPLPELPPQESGLLSLVEKDDHPVGRQDYPANAEPFPDTPNSPSLGEHPTLIEKRAEIERAWEQKKAQEQAESSAAKEDAFARAEAEQAPLTLEPGQGTSGLFGFGKPSPLGGVGKKQGGAIDINGIWDGVGRLADGVRVLLKDGRIGTVVKSTMIKNTNPEAWSDLHSKLHDQAFQGYVSGQHTLEQAKAIADRLMEQNKDKLHNALHSPNGESWIPRVSVDGERPRIMQSDMIEKVLTGPTKTLGGTGKKGFSQGGAIGFGFGEKITKAFSPKTFEEFAKDFYEKNPDLANASESSVRAAYEKMYPMKSKGALQAKAFGDLVGDKDTYNKYESRPVMDDPLGEKSVERMKGLSGADSEPLGVVKSNVMSAGRMPSWMSKSPIIHEGIQFITSVKDHYRVKSADTMSPINKLFNASERGLSQFVKGIKDTWREAAEVLSVRREHEFDPTFDPKTQFSGKQLELFTKIDETLKNLYTEINARRKQLDPKAQDLPQLPYYFTSFFKGDWAVPVFDSTTGQFLFNLRETKKADAIKAQEWVNQQQGMVAKEVGLLKQSKYVDKKMDAASDFDTLLKTFGSNDPAVVAAMQRLANSSKRKAGNTAGMPNRFLNKEGRFGSLGDKPWLSDKENYYGNKEALTRYIEGANDWLANTQIAKFSEGMLKSEKEINAPNAIKFIQDYSDYVIGKKEIASQITKGVDSAISHFFNRSTGDATSGVRTWANALTAQYIGYFSPRAMIQNVFQPISATVPKMLEMGLIEGYKGNPFTALMVGMAEGVLDSLGHATHLPYKTQTLKFKEANHVVDAHLVESGGTFKNVFANDLYDAAANFSVAATEALARSQGFSIFYHYLKSSGMDSAKAMDMAKNLTKEHMVNYEQYAKPQMFGATGIVGEMAGRLQTYKMNATTQMAEYLTKMNHNPKTWVPFSTALGINIALAGAMGVMGMDVAELLWKGIQLADQKITGGNNEIQEWTPKRFIFETLPSSVSMGVLSTATGMDLSGAFAQNLVGDNAAQSVMPIVGGMINQVAAVPQLLSSNNDADTAKALSAFTPTTVKPYVEREFSTMKRPDGDTQVLSPTTGNTVYRGPDQGYAKGTTGLLTGEGLLSNIRTLDRGYKAYENKFDTEYNHGISVRLKGIEDKTTKVINDIVKAAVAGKDNPFAKAIIGENFTKYVEIGGDPNDLLNKINNHVQSLAIGDKLVEELSKDITLRNRKQIQHAFELYQRRQEHGSATTSK